MRVKWGKMTGMHKKSEGSKDARLRVPVQRAVSEDAVPMDNTDNAATPISAEKQRNGHRVNYTSRRRPCHWTRRRLPAQRIALQVSE